MRRYCNNQQPRHRNNTKTRRGGALISALFITALAAIMATALAVQEGLLIHEGQLAMRADEGYLALQAMRDAALLSIENYVVQWPEQQLLQQQQPNQPQNPPKPQGNTQTPTQIQPLPTTLQPLKLGGREVVASLAIEQGKFNINDLAYTANQPNFVALLQAVIPGTSQHQASDIAKAITNWIMTGADDHYYATLTPPYLSSKNELTNISELRLIDGITPAVYTALAPYVTALPVIKPTLTPTPNASGNNPPPPPPPQQASSPPPQQTAILTPIDINSASVPVLMAANPGLNVGQAESIVDCRQAHGAFATTAAFLSACVQPSGVPSLQNITTQSRYFSMDSRTVVNNTVLSMKSLLVTRITKNNKLKLDVVWQSFE